MKYLLIFVLMCSCAYKQEKADLVVHNARIYTCNKDFDIAQAMAVRDGKIVEIGAERQIMNKYRADKFIDNELKPVYPLFIGSDDFVQSFIDRIDELEGTETDRQEILYMLTAWKAKEEFVEDETGSLKEHRYADFFITNLDLLKLDRVKLGNVKVLETYKEGKRVD